MAKQLFNQCLYICNIVIILSLLRRCGMKFDSTEQLATHQKKFCIDSENADLNQLDQKLKENVDYGRRPYEGLTGIETVPTQELKTKKEYGILHNNRIQERELQMQSELDKLKAEKAEFRAKKQQEEQTLADLIKETELKKEKDLRARIERDSIKKELMHLEKSKLTVLEQEKKVQLEKLSVDREQLRLREDQLIKEVNKLENDMKTMDRVRNEDIKKQEDVLDKFKKKGDEKKKVSDMLLEQKSDKVAQFKIRREQLELERQQIMGDLERVKAGDLTSVRKNNYGIFAANQVLNDINGIKSYGINDIREKIRRDGEKLEQLKNDQKSTINREHIYPEYEFTSPPTVPGLNNSSGRRVQSTHGLQRSYRDELLNRVGPGDASFFDSHLNPTSSNKPKTLPENYHNSPELAKTFIQKEIEAENLRKEIDLLKMQQNLKSGSNIFTLGEMQRNQNSLGTSSATSDNFNILANTREFFIQNEARAVDLTEDERILLNLQAQEIDALRLISQIPIGTDLYRFKMDQFKELSTMRAEAEKIVQEQRLIKMKRDFDKVRREEDRKFENERWIDEQRKQVIVTRLKQENQVIKEDRKYDSLNGLVIHWDYGLGVPKKSESCQVVFGIYLNGSEVYSPKLLEPHPCEIDTSITNRCIFGKSYPISDISAHPNALLIFEVQLFPSKESTNPRLVSYGWSQLDLFDPRRELKRGKFKIPLYECPTNINQDIDGIKHLTPVQEGISWIYIRISYQQDNGLDKIGPLYPEDTYEEYIIPQIHLRSFRPPVDTNFLQHAKPRSNQSSRPYPSEVYQSPYSQMIPQRQDSHIIQQSVNLKSLTEEDSEEKSEGSRLTSAKLKSTTNPKKAIQVVIHALRNHLARNHLRVSCALLEDAKILIDDAGQNCAFNTQIHNPYENIKNISMASTTKMRNFAKGNDIVFRESHKFYKDLNKIVQNNKGQKDYYIMFQVLEKPEPAKLPGNYGSVQMTEISSYGRLEYDLFGWLLYKISRPDGRIFTGKFVKNLFSSPLKKPPFDFSNEKKSDCEVEFSINEVEWDDSEDGDNNTETEENDDTA